MEHHVYFWLKEAHRNDADRQAFEDGLRALFKIPQVAGGLFGKPADVMERPVIDTTWDYATSMRFESVEDQDAYQVHPDHDAFIEKFSSWWEKVQVRDLQPL
ncbi:Dabb family protein [Haloferula rosea]|uniref:Dabb family protein n=1 Tax=Haloferula rosea TaxID=490093 RepID=A0A934RFS7_9BACT|nr:Dabb family protein [Haloferula rosea]MBK1828793.1 Dabb family protein [Haloferula rosea]